MDNFRPTCGSFAPVNNQSERILKNRGFAFVGVSPFNSYFSVETIFNILYNTRQNFDDFAIFIPDKISYFTLKAQGYEDNRIKHKIRKQENYLINRVKKALDYLYGEESGPKHYNKIILLSEIEKIAKYQEVYNECIEIFNQDETFKNGCLQTSEWVLASGHKLTEEEISMDAKNIAVEYFLRELPLFLKAPEILGVDSCTFIYRVIPSFLKEIYDRYPLTSVNQGFSCFVENENRSQILTTFSLSEARL
ncbi:MAG: tRNA-dependent cyclodipeptide synthase [Rickettsiaceae bacterium]|nr:tRNA-dependent cyclodipeptide synthase [Rickettsiaceae bacterium]